MVRSPCCEKMGLKKGPWTIEEDQILVSHIQRCGHGNWRTLPKQAGLLRCGKSCRLRWTNYLRPDIKRGNFTVEEEETIITLHAMLGNRWSAIAAKLPGRTDNEIKNVWHAHLKKRVHPSSDAQKETQRKLNNNNNNNNNTLSSEIPATLQFNPSGLTTTSSSLQSSTSDFSSSSVTRECNEGCSDEFPELPDLDESFWLEALSVKNPNTSMELVVSEAMPSSSPIETASFLQHEDDMDFWLKVLLGSGELSQLPTI